MKLEKIGLQLFTIRDHMDTPEHVRESFRYLKSMGYDQAQTAGCAIPYETFGQIAAEEGIEIVGTHDDWNMMLNDPEQAVRNHQLLGTHLMGTGGGGTQILNSEAELLAFCGQCNRIGQTIKPYGMKFTYHNHTGEFKKIKGKLAMEIMMEELDPETTSFCLDTCWVHQAGMDECEWIEKLSGRIDIIHLKDWGIWSNNEGNVMEIGSGNMNWQRILEASGRAGVRYYIVEQDNWEGDSLDSAHKSACYLRRHFMV